MAYNTARAARAIAAIADAFWGKNRAALLKPATFYPVGSAASVAPVAAPAPPPPAASDPIEDIDRAARAAAELIWGRPSASLY